jgi:hypothetical protein
MTTWTATIEKTKTAQPMGIYQPTAIDARKAAADILVSAAEPNGYSIRSKYALSGRGIRSHGNGNYSVSEPALSGLRARFAVECDF